MPELDGLRAIAILLVLAFHLEVPQLSLGWAGVPLFFVLSGFLITGILLDARGRPNYFRNFYARRALRIFPIYYLTLFVVAAAALALGQRVDSLPFYLVYVQNYLLGATNFKPDFPIAFNHSWSLAIEEQFYLLWPLAVLWLSRRKLLVVALALFALGFASRALLLVTTRNATLMDASLPGQLDALAAGAALAILVSSGIQIKELASKAWWVLGASGAALAALIYHNGLDSYWHPDTWATRPYNLPTLSLLAILFASLISISLAGTPVLSAILRLTPLRHLGKISYGVYMYHFPVFFVVDRLLWNAFPGETTWAWGLGHPATKLVFTFIIAFASWRLIESPLLRLKDRFSAPGTEGESAHLPESAKSSRRLPPRAA